MAILGIFDLTSCLQFDDAFFFLFIYLEEFLKLIFEYFIVIAGMFLNFNFNSS